MPIILLWNETVAGRLAQFGRWIDSFERSNLLIERWLEKRLPAAEEMERFSSRFPVFRFYNEAVTARISRSQYGALLTDPVPGIGQHLERALGQWNVGRRVGAAYRETRLLPELFRVLEEITGGVLASIDRFRRPTAAMFDPRRRSAADLPGLAVLAYRAIATSQRQILTAATNVRDAFVPPTAAGEESDGGAGADPTARASGAAASALPLAFRLDELARYLVAGLLVLPAIGRLLGVIGRDLLLHVRYVVVDLFARIETRVHAFRRDILAIFLVDLEAYARQGVALVLAVKEIALDYIRFYARVGIEYLRGIVDGVDAFAGQLQDFWTGLVGVIHKVVRYGNAILGIDIGPVLHRGFEAVEDAIETIDTHLYSIADSPEEYDAPAQFPVTVGEMVMNQGAGARGNAELAEAIDLLVKAWRGADPMAAAINAGLIHRITGYHIPNLIGALHMVTQALGLPRPGTVTQPTLTLDLSSVPNLTDELIIPLRDGVTQAVESGVNGVARGIEGVVVAAMDTLDSTAVAFDAAAERASRMGSLRLLRRLTSNTDALMQTLFGDQEIRRRETGFEPVAGAYAQWLIQGGFDTVGAALAGFVGMVLDEWTEHLEEGTDTPFEVTKASPRKLLERARLGRVHTPELRITVRGDEMGRPLAGRIADRFQKAVQEAYATGQQRLNQTLAAAQAAGSR